MSKTRIYLVQNADPESVMLVRASSQAQAIRFAIDPYHASVATQDQLVQLLAAGKEVHNAAAEPVQA